MPQIKFTDTNLKTLSADATTWFSDPTAKGLQLCVTAGGVKTWYVNKWDSTAQKTRRIKLGQWSNQGKHCAWAKKEVGRAASNIEDGVVKTKQEKAVERAGIPTLREAFELDAGRRQNPDDPNDRPVDEKTVAYYRSLLDRHLGSLQDQSVDVLDGRAIQLKLDNLYRANPYAAHKLHCALRYARPQVEKALNTENLPYRWPRLDKMPTMRDRKDHERANAKVVMDVTIPWSVRWAKIQAVENEHKRLCWQVRWFTGFRGVGLRSLRWSDVDLKAGTFMVSTGLKRVKGKRLIAMSDQVKAWFERLREIRFDDCEWVFPSRRIVGDARGHLDQLDSLEMDGPIENSMGEGHLRHAWNEAAVLVDTREMVLHWLTGQALAKGEQKNLGLYATVPVERQRKVANEIASVISTRIGIAPSNVVTLPDTSLGHRATSL
jgi:integrase